MTASIKLPLLQQPLRLPLTVQALQFAAHMRITLFPLLEDLPFVGSATATLLQPPHINFELPVSCEL